MTTTDLDLALNEHKYVVSPGGEPAINITTIAKLLDIDGKSSAFAGAAVKIAKAGGDYRREWRESGEQGTRVHGYLENFLLGRAIDFRPGEEGFVAALEGFIEQEDPQLIIDPEFVVVSAVGYGGRGDLAAVLKRDGEAWLLDLKSGKQYAYEHTLQLALLRYARLAHYDSNGMLAGTEQMPEFAHAGCLYVRADGTWQLVEYPADEAAYQAALCLLGAYNWTRRPEVQAAANAWKEGRD